MKETRFKYTEVGKIPEEWNIEPIGNLFIFKNGLNKAKSFFGYGTPIVNYTDVYNHRGIKKQDINGLVCLSHDEISRYLVKDGDVFFTRTSETPEEVGLTSVLLEDIPNCSFSGFVLRARPINGKINKYYCQYCFSAQLIRKLIINSCTYTTRALTNGGVLSRIPLCIPPLSEQTRIASALTSVDNLLTSLGKLIEKKRAIKQGAMQMLLTGKKRLKGFEGEWVEKKLGEIGSKYAYGVSAEAVSYNGSDKYIRITDIDEESHRYNPIPLVSPAFYSENHLVEENDVLVARTGASVGKTYWYDKNDGKLIFAGFLMKFHVENDCSKYVFYSMCSNRYKQWVLSESMRSGQPGLNLEQLKSFLLLLPSPSEQTRIASVLTSMDNEITALEAKKKKYEAIKQGMMQQLLTGRIRLVD